ncbi:MAG TPA: hypothetical protein DCL64_00910 [Ruminococcaceae bacterium]|nr:hypothetical protein [Oscillospiraceae bacterium]
MSDEQLANLLFVAGFALMLASMVLGPFGILRWALTTAVLACFLAIATMAIAFQGWGDVRRPEDDSQKTKQFPPAKPPKP